MNFGELKTRVNWYLDRGDMSSMASSIINDVRQELATGVFMDERGKPLKVYWPWLYTTVTVTTSAGVSDYDLPTNYLDHMEVVIGKKKLHRYTQVDWSNQMLDDEDWSEQNGEPAEFFLIGELIRLKPPPDNNDGNDYSLVFHYYAAPSAFSIDSHSDYMSRLYPYVIIHAAVLQCAIILDDRDKIRMHGPLYDKKLLEAIKNELGKKFEHTSPNIRTYRDFETTHFKSRFRVRS